jgi:hypothetical protein
MHSQPVTEHSGSDSAGPGMQDALRDLSGTIGKIGTKSVADNRAVIIVLWLGKSVPLFLGNTHRIVWEQWNLSLQHTLKWFRGKAS